MYIKGFSDNFIQPTFEQCMFTFLGHFSLFKMDLYVWFLVKDFPKVILLQCF